jgi:hypothetical protein
MADIPITCPHCDMHITFGLGNGSGNSKNNELLGFVFTCPNCRTPVSYQAKEDYAVELDKKTFESFQRAMKKRMSEPGGVALTRQKRTAVAQKPIDEDIFSDMLKDIRESDSYDDFLRRIGS